MNPQGTSTTPRVVGRTVSSEVTRTDARNAAQAPATLKPTTPVHTTTDLSNPSLLATHLAMAAAELPLQFGLARFEFSDDALVRKLLHLRLEYQAD